MDNHSFSVLMSLYINEKAEYFRECMDSILSQTVLPSEIVIVKDGPVAKDVDDLIDNYRQEHPELINVVAYDVNRGLGYALSVGVEACSCELIARMDTDDIARGDRFEKQLDEFRKDPSLDICGSYIDEFEGNVTNIVSKRIVPTEDGEIKRYQKRRDAFNHMTVMYKKSAVLAAGNYQTSLLMEDTLLWVNMMLTGARCRNIPECLVHARVGEGMYERRGGFSYFKKYRNGKRKVLETGYISYFDYLVTVLVQFAVAMMPGSLRGFFFKKILHR